MFRYFTDINDKFGSAVKGIMVFVFIAGLLFSFWTTRAIAEAAKKKATANEQILLNLTQLQANLDGRLEMMVKLGAIRQKTWEDLRSLSTEPLDGNGRPVAEWYIIGDSAIYKIKGCSEVKMIPFFEDDGNE